MQNQSRKGQMKEALRFAVVGPGRVGSSFAHWLMASGCRLERLAGRNPAQIRVDDLVEAAGGFDKESLWCPIDQLVTDDLDLLLITVSDPSIAAVAETLAARPQAPVILHAAGRYDAEVLSPLRSSASAVGSLHPLRAFVDTLEPESWRGTWFAIDGDLRAESMAGELVSCMGGFSVKVNGQQREIYHLAATLAAGGVTTLLAVVEELMVAAGLPPSMLGAYLGLTRGALAPIESFGGPVARRITGPAARGDVESLGRQRAVLGVAAPHLLPLLEGLQEETLRQCGWASSEVLEEPDKIPPPAKGKSE